MLWILDGAYAKRAPLPGCAKCSFQPSLPYDKIECSQINWAGLETARLLAPLFAGKWCKQGTSNKASVLSNKASVQNMCLEQGPCMLKRGRDYAQDLSHVSPCSPFFCLSTRGGACQWYFQGLRAHEWEGLMRLIGCLSQVAKFIDRRLGSTCFSQVGVLLHASPCCALCCFWVAGCVWCQACWPLRGQPRLAC